MQVTKTIALLLASGSAIQLEQKQGSQWLGEDFFNDSFVKMPTFFGGRLFQQSPMERHGDSQSFSSSSSFSSSTDANGARHVKKSHDGEEQVCHDGVCKMIQCHNGKCNSQQGAERQMHHHMIEMPRIDFEMPSFDSFERRMKNSMANSMKQMEDTFANMQKQINNHEMHGDGFEKHESFSSEQSVDP